jgi:ribosomal protein L11 methyltransferase
VRTWLKVTAVLPAIPLDWSRWHERFARNGIEGTLQTDEPPTVSAYLPPGEESVLALLREDLESYGATVATEEVEEVDWAEAWKAFFKPTAVGERLWIRPSWEDSETPDGRVEIVLDPGQAFGTGDHPTTRLCLEMLESVVRPRRSVADIGCGSGILSVAACKLGACHIDAVDTDPVSIEATLENARRNACAVSAFVGAGFAPLGEATYDVVVSNIISAAVIGLASEARGRVRAGGSWIVSGIIEPNWPDVYEAVAANGFEVEEWRKEGDWTAAILRR